MIRLRSEKCHFVKRLCERRRRVIQTEIQWVQGYGKMQRDRRCLEKSTELGDDGMLRSKERKVWRAQSVVWGKREHRRPRKAKCLAQVATL